MFAPKKSTIERYFFCSINRVYIADVIILKGKNSHTASNCSSIITHSTIKTFREQRAFINHVLTKKVLIKNITTTTRFSIVDLLYELPIPTRFSCVFNKKSICSYKKSSYKKHYYHYKIQHKELTL